jgi:iron complex outermembrane receptor protein
VVAGSRLSYDFFNRLSLGLMTKYVGRQYMDNTSSDERMLDPYLLNDIHLRFSTPLSFADQVSFTLMVNNALDTRYESNAWIYRYYSGGEHYTMYGYYPQAGRHFMLGLSLGF